MAAAAVARSTPSISNRILPGRITATHCLGAPLPFPIRVSAGFLVIGLSGKRRIQTLPPRLIKRVIATRAASICRSVIQPHRMAFKPKSPKARDDPRQAFPVMRPRCCFLYFTFFGINMEEPPQHYPANESEYPPNFRCSDYLRPCEFLFLGLLGSARGWRVLPQLLLPTRLGRSQRRDNRRGPSCLRHFPWRRLHHSSTRLTCRRGDRCRTPAFAWALTVPPVCTWWPSRLRLIPERRAPAGHTIQNLALICPALNADHAVGRVGLRETVIQI